MQNSMLSPCLCVHGSPCNVLVTVLACYLGDCVELSCVLRLSCIVLHLPCLCESSFVAFSFSHPTPPPNSKTSRPNAPYAHPFRAAPLAKTPVKIPPFGLLASAYTLLRGFPPPTPAKTFSAPPLSTPEPGPLHLEDSLLLMMFLFGHAVEIRKCSFQRHADDSHLPKADSCWSRDPTSPGCRTALDPPRYHVMWPGFHGEEYQ
jgi:hypothetical protein